MRAYNNFIFKLTDMGLLASIIKLLDMFQATRDMDYGFLMSSCNVRLTFPKNKRPLPEADLEVRQTTA